MTEQEWIAKMQAKYGVVYQVEDRDLETMVVGRFGDAHEEYEWEVQYIAKHGCITYMGGDDTLLYLSHKWVNDLERKWADHPLPEELQDTFQVIDVVKVANRSYWLLVGEGESHLESAYWLMPIPV